MLNSYSYCANNPIIFIDSNGMEFTPSALSHVKRLTDEMDSRIKGMDEDIASQRAKLNKEGLTEKQKSKINKKIEKLESERTSMKADFEETRAELATLEASSQKYDITESNKFSESSSNSMLGTTTYRGAAGFNFTTGVFEITIPNKALELLAHELKHAYQFEIGEYSVGPDLSNRGGNLFYDKHDEVEAFARGSLFGGIKYSINNLPDVYQNLSDKQNNKYTVNSAAYLVMKGHPNATKHYQNLARATGHAFRIDGTTYYTKR